jgi:hypothetical protein
MSNTDMNTYSYRIIHQPEDRGGSYQLLMFSNGKEVRRRMYSNSPIITLEYVMVDAEEWVESKGNLPRDSEH